MKIRLGVIAIITMLLLVGCTERTTRFYVATDGNDGNVGSVEQPFATLERARGAVRQLLASKADGDVEVIIRSGDYFLSRTLILGLEDSAQKGQTITYKAYPGEGVVVTSGRKINGWKKLRVDKQKIADAAKGNLWVANVPSVRSGDWYFRTLYDGQDRLPRARGPVFKSTEIIPESFLAHRYRPDLRDDVHFPVGAIRNWDNLSDIELLKGERNFRNIVSVDERSQIAKLGVLETYATGNRPEKTKNKGYHIENAIEYLDEPGEWVLNSKEGKLYYWPEDGTVGNNIQAPVLDELIRVEGKNVDSIEGDIPVRGIVFDGLTFALGKRVVWLADDKAIQHGWGLFDKNNALLRFRGAEDCAVRNCTIRSTGANGIRLDLYCNGIEIAGNHIYDIGECGIFMGGYGPGLKDVNKNNTVFNNEIHGCARVINGKGILIWQSGHNVVKNNLIYDIRSHAVTISGVRPRYFGIYDGYKWKTEYEDFKGMRDLMENMRTIRWDEVGEPSTYQEIWRFSHSRGNVIEDNEMHDCMTTPGDGNVVYLSGGGKGNIVRRNLIYRFYAWAIRTDDDQDGTVMRDNIIFGKAFKLKHTYNKIENNILIDGGDNSLVIMTNSPTCSIAKNIFLNTSYLHSKNVFAPTYTDKSSKAVIDNNIFHFQDAAKGKQFFDDMRKRGHEKNGVYGDPMFKDLKNGYVDLEQGSPAMEAGFEPFDVSRIGLIEKPAFERLRKQGFAEAVNSDEFTLNDPTK